MKRDTRFDQIRDGKQYRVHTVNGLDGSWMERLAQKDAQEDTSGKELDGGRLWISVPGKRTDNGLIWMGRQI